MKPSDIHPKTVWLFTSEGKVTLLIVPSSILAYGSVGSLASVSWLSASYVWTQVMFISFGSAC